MGTVKRLGVALLVGVGLAGLAALVALLTGDEGRFWQVCFVIAVACNGIVAIMSGTLFVGSSYPSRAAMGQVPAPTPDQDPIGLDPDNRSRFNSVYVATAGLPSIIVVLIHYL